MLALACWSQAPAVGIQVSSITYGEKVTAHLLNASGKDISAFAVQCTIYYSDGGATVSEKIIDYLPAMISVEQAGHSLTPDNGSGAFLRDAVIDLDLTDPKTIEQASVNVEAIVYADKTAQVRNRQGLRNILALRQANVLALETANEYISKALADPQEQHPSEMAAKQLEAYAATLKSTGQNLSMDDPLAHEPLSLTNTAKLIRQAPQSSIGRTREEEEYLNNFITEHRARIAAIKAHTQLQEVPQ